MGVWMTTALNPGCAQTWTHEQTWVPCVMKEARSTDAECPWKVLRQLPSVRAHSRMVASPLPVSTHWSMGENCALQTPRRCPRSVSVWTRSGNRHTCAAHCQAQQSHRHYATAEAYRPEADSNASSLS